MTEGGCGSDRREEGENNLSRLVYREGRRYVVREIGCRGIKSRAQIGSIGDVEAADVSEFVRKTKVIGLTSLQTWGGNHEVCREEGILYQIWGLQQGRRVQPLASN